MRVKTNGTVRTSTTKLVHHQHYVLVILGILRAKKMLVGSTETDIVRLCYCCLTGFPRSQYSRMANPGVLG